ncbi:uncharacterized protein METZ01_LOCUS514110, partial [marine metagenome]
PDLLIASHFWVALCGVSLVLTASVWGGLAGGAVANLGAGDWVEATRPFHLVNLAGESLLFTSAILFAVNLHWAIGFPWRACCPISGNQETEPIEAVMTEEPEEILTEEERAAKNSMELTTLTFILATILVIAFAGVVYSLIL